MLLPSSKRDGFGQSIGLGIGIIFELATHWSLDSKSLLIYTNPATESVLTPVGHPVVSGLVSRKRR